MTVSGSRAQVEQRCSVTRVVFDSPYEFAITRARFEAVVPAFDQLAALELVVRDVAWPEVEKQVSSRVGPTGFVALSRVDQGALMSLGGRTIEATQYLVGNPLVAITIIEPHPALALHAPFQVAIFGDHSGTHLSYLTPSSLFPVVDNPAVQVIAADLDARMLSTAQQVCQL